MDQTACVVSNCWADFQWPEWVSSEIRAEVESFWAPTLGGRSPGKWKASADRYKSPILQEVGRARSMTGTEFLYGKFVYAWGNIGRLLDEAGRWHCVSFFDGNFPYEGVQPPPPA